MCRPAAFFDLDRTLIRRSSALALAPSFHERGLISRRHLARAAALQLLFALRGADEEGVQRLAAEGLLVLRGVAPEELKALVAEAMKPVLRPLVLRGPLELARRHREAGEPVYVVSTALQEIVDGLAEELELDGALGTVCEVEDGVYTGRSLRPLHGEAKAEAVRELAEREELELARSTAYSDGASDLPLLEAVGRPTAVNPDRALRRVALERGWPVLEYRVPLQSRPRRMPPAAYALPLVLGAGAAWAARRRAA